MDLSNVHPELGCRGIRTPHHTFVRIRQPCAAVDDLERPRRNVGSGLTADARLLQQVGEQLPRGEARVHVRQPAFQLGDGIYAVLIKDHPHLVATGIGVLQAAADDGKLSIGVDSNQNYLHPGSVLTSMLKRVHVAAYEVFKTAMDDSWMAGIRNLGLAEDGVGWAPDDHNRPLINAAMAEQVESARAAIVAGDLSVHDYMANNSCN